MLKRMRPQLLPLLTLAALAGALGAACDGGGAPAGATPTATGAAATATSDASRPDELGEEPIFYRPLDEGFASLRAGEPYKILFRVTGGYAEDTLSIVATPAEGEALEFEASRAEPAGEGDPPGSYYPFNLELPAAGTWAITVTAGDDETTFSVEVKAAAAGPGDLRY
jgi:hypothetical protein